MKKLIVLAIAIASQSALANAKTLDVTYTKPEKKGYTEYHIKTAAFAVDKKPACTVNNIKVTENSDFSYVDCGDHQAGVKVTKTRYQNIGLDWTVTNIVFSLDLPNQKLEKEYQLDSVQRYPKDY